MLQFFLLGFVAAGVLLLMAVSTGLFQIFRAKDRAIQTYIVDERIAIGTASPAYPLEVFGTVSNSGSLLVRLSDPSKSFDLYPLNAVASAGHFQTRQSTANATLSGASTVIHIDVPTGAKLLGTTWIISAEVTSGDGATSLSLAYSGGSTQAIATGQAFAPNTKGATMFVVNTDTDIAASEVDITVTPNANTFSGGVIYLTTFYQVLNTFADGVTP